MSGMAAIVLGSMGGVAFGATASSIVHVLVRGGVMPRRPRTEPTWTRAEVDRLTATAFQAGRADAVLGEVRDLMAYRAQVRGIGPRPSSALEIVRGELPGEWR